MKELFNQSATANRDGEQFTKPKRLIEHAADNPLYVLHEIFDYEGPDSIRETCREWFYVTIICNDCTYSDNEQRAGLIAFYKKLLPLLEALYIILEKEEPSQHPIPFEPLLNPEQSAAPLTVVAAFYNSFSIEYVRRELWDWLEAGISFTGTYPGNMNEAEALSIYEKVLCLLEAGWQWQQYCNTPTAA